MEGHKIYFVSEWKNRMLEDPHQEKLWLFAKQMYIYGKYTGSQVMLW